MILINFSHPLTTEQKGAIEYLTATKITRVVERMAHFEVDRPFAEQTTSLVNELALDPRLWQQSALVVALPSLNVGVATVLAELHGRCGYFPPVVRLRPAEGSLPPRYEVAEIINLQAMRDAARRKREE
jgi:hypothetical protein